MAKHLQWLGLLCLLAGVLFFGNLNVEMCTLALNMWFEKLVPSMFVVMVLVKMLFLSGALTWLAKPFGFLLGHVFGIDTQSFAYVIAMIFLGFPAGASFINEQVIEGALSKQDAARLIHCCSFATPGFVILTCGSVLFHSSIIGIQLFLIQIGCGLLLLLTTRFHHIHASKTHTTITPIMEALPKAIMESGKTLYMIGGYLMICMGVTAILVQGFPVWIQLPIRILSEFSSGSVLLSELSLSPQVILTLLSMLLSFGGFCVHMQVMCMAEDCALSYRTYVTFRVIQALLSGCLAFLIFS